jgi:hypothetical protein
VAECSGQCDTAERGGRRRVAGWQLSPAVVAAPEVRVRGCWGAVAEPDLEGGWAWQWEEAQRCSKAVGAPPELWLAGRRRQRGWGARVRAGGGGGMATRAHDRLRGNLATILVSQFPFM